MKTQYRTWWLPAVLAAGGILGFAAAGGYLVWGIIVSFVWAVCFYCWHRYDVSRLIKETDREIRRHICDEKDRAFLQAASAHRHDLMNEIQLLLGYLQLQKYDKVKEFADMMKEKAAQESALFHLGVPGLTLFLYELQTDRVLELVLEIEPGLQLDQLLSHPREFGNLLIDLIQSLRGCAVKGDSVPRLTLELYMKDGRLHAAAELAGENDRHQARARYNKWKAEAEKRWPQAEFVLKCHEHALQAAVSIPAAANFSERDGKVFHFFH